MNGMGFRQSNAWLHTWSGLLLGWLMYAIFVTGTISFFRDEISFWMQPEQHVSMADEGTPERVLSAMQKMAPDASVWSVSLPGPRDAAVRVQWFDQGEKPSKFGGHRVALDAGTAQVLPQRESRGADFLYRFHFELYGMPRIAARWIVGIATMMMLIAIVSGVITHKKIFADFFTFRPRKGQRSWMDAHNALAVLSLPFHFMITYSGLLLLMFMLMPWGVQSAYNGDMRAYFNERGARVTATAPASHDQPFAAPLAEIGPIMAQARARWPHGVDHITVTSPGTSQAVIELRERGADSLLDRGRSERLQFDGVSGALLESVPPPALSPVTATYNVFSSLHLLRFAGPWLRWLFFLAGFAGSAMVATGLILWVVKRLPQRRKQGSHIGHHLVERLNVATIAGLLLAVAAYFWANRLLPVEMAARADWEIRIFFIAWASCLIHACLRPHRQAWIEQLPMVSILYFLLPVYSFIYFDMHLLNSLAAGQWLVAGVDLSLWAVALFSAAGVWFLRTRQAASKRSSGAATTVKGRSYAGL
jgi:uncharacterized iron-regulated membrane protein